MHTPNKPHPLSQTSESVREKRLAGRSAKDWSDLAPAQGLMVSRGSFRVAESSWMGEAPAPTSAGGQAACLRGGAFPEAPSWVDVANLGNRQLARAF
jgi:hypothetical protein